jgi:hypothetical protein
MWNATSSGGREYQPAVSGINAGKLKHTAKKGSVGFWIL